MEKRCSSSTTHVVAVAYPSQGHLNPMLQFCKRLVSKGVRVSFVFTKFITKSFNPLPSCGVNFETISDGHDDYGFAGAASIKSYIQHFQSAGSQSLLDVINKHKSSENPVTCVVADAFLPWALEISSGLGLKGVLFFTQSCVVNYIYYLVHLGKLSVPLPSDPVSIEDGLPSFGVNDMPSFISLPGSYAAYFEMVVNQFSNVEKADFILVNSFYKLEKQEAEAMSRFYPLFTIGPTIPSSYLDKRIHDDTHYSINLFSFNANYCSEWLRTTAEGSVVYVAFGSMANLSKQQMEELSWGLDESGFHFLWVVRNSEQWKLPSGFVEKTKYKGLVVGWSSQLEVLSHSSIGCFFTHCGWNSTTEALTLGVPMVAMPQWTDQPTNAKYVEDVWKVGVRVKVDEESGVVKRDEITSCLKEVMGGEAGMEIRRNAAEWRQLAIEAVGGGGSSDSNTDAFVSRLVE